MNFREMLQPIAERIAQLTDAPLGAVWFFAGMVAALAVGSTIRMIVHRMRPAAVSASLLASLLTWWSLIGALAVAFALGQTGIVLLAGFLSWLALREFLHVYPRNLIPPKVALAAQTLIPIQYFWIWLGWETAALVFVPLAMLVILPAVRMASARPQHFIASIGAVFLAVVISIYGLSHTAFFHLLPENSNPTGGAWGWLFFLIVLTEANDMAQAFTGRWFGRRYVTPHISPNKTLEGYVGGVVVTMVLAPLLASWITPLNEPPPAWAEKTGVGAPYFPALIAGMIIAVGGIVGDLTMSSCKRDCGVKDFGSLLPGQGGILDRFDSLTIAAPLFFHFVRMLDY